MDSKEFWNDFGELSKRIAKSREPVKLYMSNGGHPTFVYCTGYITIGVYTVDVTYRQVLEDIAEADRERRRKFS